MNEEQSAKVTFGAGGGGERLRMGSANQAAPTRPLTNENSPTLSELARVFEGMRQTASLVEQLHTRLDHVLSPSAPSAAGTTAPPPAGTSPLVAGLVDMRIFGEQINGHLITLLQRLEI